MNIEYLTPSAAHTDRIAHIESVCFGAAAWSRDSVLAFVENEFSHVTAAACDGEIVGYAGVIVIAGEGEITNVAVLPEYRRRGIARALVSAVEKTARDLSAELLHLEVREGNVAARALYEAAGFAAVGRRRGYYTHPREDAILMTKILKNE